MEWALKTAQPEMSKQYSVRHWIMLRKSISIRTDRRLAASPTGPYVGSEGTDVRNRDSHTAEEVTMPVTVSFASDSFIVIRSFLLNLLNVELTRHTHKLTDTMQKGRTIAEEDILRESRK
jgi:hypothetical protein